MPPQRNGRQREASSTASTVPRKCAAAPPHLLEAGHQHPAFVPPPSAAAAMQSELQGVAPAHKFLLRITMRVGQCCASKPGSKCGSPLGSRNGALLSLARTARASCGRALAAVDASLAQALQRPPADQGTMRRRRKLAFCSGMQPYGESSNPDCCLFLPWVPSHVLSLCLA